MPGFEEADKFKPTTSRPPALHLRFYSSVSVWRGTEGGGVDAHRKRHLEEHILTPGNKRERAYGCHLDLIASQNTSEVANCECPRISALWASPSPPRGSPARGLAWRSPPRGGSPPLGADMPPPVPTRLPAPQFPRARCGYGTSVSDKEGRGDDQMRCSCLIRGHPRGGLCLPFITSLCRVRPVYEEGRCCTPGISAAPLPSS